ncbi:MAG: hypothetical protein ACI4A5_11085 [Hominilimicola sp.]
MEVRELKPNLGKLVLLNSYRLRHTGKYILSAIIMRLDSGGKYKYSVELKALQGNCVIISEIDSVFALSEEERQQYAAEQTNSENPEADKIKNIQAKTFQKLEEINSKNKKPSED